jgi:transposase-like protein
MDEPTRKGGRLHEGRPGTLGALIHEAVRRVIEVAVEEELTAALGAVRYARDVSRGGYRNGHRSRALTGPTGPLALTLPRAMLFTATGAREWDLSARPPVPTPAARGE